MSDNLKKWLPILCVISEIEDKKLQKNLLRYFSKKKSFMLSLREISKNIIKGNVEMSVYKKSKLMKQRKILYSIAYEKNPLKVKKNIVQSGGSLFYILPLIASLLLK